MAASGDLSVERRDAAFGGLADFDDPAPDRVAVNGVLASTGTYAVPPLPPALLAAVAEGRAPSPAELDELKAKVQGAKTHLAVKFGIDNEDLAQAGWGVVFAADDPDASAASEALSPLLRRRQEQAGALYKEFHGPDGLRPGESGSQFLARHGSAPGPVDPKKGVPYYLLLVGTPTRIPFDVQADIDVRHAVGRLDLGGAAALAEYAQGVVAREQRADAGAGGLARRLAMFATANRGDISTQRSARRLAAPVANAFADAHAAWQVDRLLADAATKAALGALLRDPAPPAILFTATHGAVYPAGAAEQRALQGALVTQEWPGPLEAAGPLDVGARFAAEDLDPSARLDGMVAFLFACFGVGTPAADEFLPPEVATKALAPEPFESALPRALLARGAGAVIGHVERAWTASFSWPGAGSATTVFEDALAMLAQGRRVGAAVECLNQRYAEISVDLAAALEKTAKGKQNQSEVAGLWLARTDARNYVVLGDPAVRVPLAAQKPSRPTAPSTPN